jgi:site-specific DNA-methyltransferase (adenine-specific)
MKLINADCIEAMKAMPDNSVDSIVTDPPYELGFMGKSWDASGIAFNIEVWQEALRVIKPGGHLIAFSGSRTYHRMAVAIEDAGFQIRDQIMWVYGSGFPKSHNISKGIDKAAGAERTMRVNERWAERYPNGPGGNLSGNGQINQLQRIIGNPILTSDPVTDEAQQWDGWGTALKPAHEPMVLARKPLEGTVANNVLTFGTGGLNIDGTRVEGKLEGDPNRFAKTDGGNFNTSLALENHQEPVVRSEGRFPANFIHDGSDEVVALFPDTKSGALKATQYEKANEENQSIFAGAGAFANKGYGSDSGSAARFFYCAKASKRDRNEGLDGFEAKRDHDGRKDGGVGGDNPRNRTNNAKLNHHPTVKPTTLMQYLVRLVTPPNGIVLDPFMGSGSTGKACAYEGFEFIGIDQSAEYVAIAQARIDFALADKSE